MVASKAESYALKDESAVPTLVLQCSPAVRTVYVQSGNTIDSSPAYNPSPSCSMDFGFRQSGGMGTRGDEEALLESHQLEAK